MQVKCHFRTDPERGLTDPLLESPGLHLRIYSGDICDPIQIGGGNWFNPPYPKRVWRAFCKWPVLPFLMWRFPKWLGGRAGYAGFKLYGVDSPAYAEWDVGIKPEDVYDGSQAVCISIRPFASVQ